MADTIKTANTVDITLEDSQSYDTVFKINNPKSSITRQMIDDAFNPIIETGILFSKNENPFQRIKSAVTVQTTIRTKELN